MLLDVALAQNQRFNIYVICRSGNAPVGMKMFLPTELKPSQLL